MSNPEMQAAFEKKLANKVRDLSDRELISLYTDAVAYHDFKRKELLDVGANAQQELQLELLQSARDKQNEELKKEKTKREE